MDLQEALTLSRELYNKSQPDFVFENVQSHCIAVGACASIIASVCGLDIVKAGLMGYCHDMGKFVSSEEKEKTFHGITGYEFFKNRGEDELAQICLTHSFPNLDFDIEEYKSYGAENIQKAKELLKTITLTDYDLIIQISDLLVINGYSHLKDRMNFIENKYKIEHKHILIKYRNAVKLKRYIEKKYNCNLYKILGIK